MTTATATAAAAKLENAEKPLPAWAERRVQGYLNLTKRGFTLDEIKFILSESGIGLDAQLDTPSWPRVISESKTPWEMEPRA